jgi:HAMP domain-containing protein
MAKNNKKTKRNTKTVRSSTSVSALRATRAMGAITKPFVDWCEETRGASTDVALMLFEPVVAFAGHYFELTPAAEVTSFVPGPFNAAMAEWLLDYDPKVEDEIELVWGSLHAYIDFLSETDAWTGTLEDLDAIHRIFHEDDLEEGVPQLEVPALTPQQELDGLAGTVMAQRVEALLRWLGQGREVTATGALKLKEIEGAAAAVGLLARGGKSAPSKDQPVLLDGGTAEEKPVQVVRSMNELTSLVRFWTVLNEARLIDIGATIVRPTPLAMEFLSAPGELKLVLLRDVTTKFLEVTIAGEDEWAPWVGEAASALAGVLFAAATSPPPGLEKIRTLLTDVEGPLQGGMAGRMALGRLEYLAEMGLVVLGQRVTVPPAVVASVAEAFADTFAGSSEESEEDEWAVSHFPLDPNAPILQLKVSINRTSPPIWRRLLVNSGVVLGDLHTIIQSSFEWEDTHLHAFQVGGRGGAVYGPPNPEQWGEPDLNENAYTLGEVIPAEGDSIVYTYDFGDDWEHLVKVEKVLPADQQAPAARCTGGRGMGPAEDSGGPHGWALLVEAVKDPRHKEHKEYRGWLGLAKGEKFDPTYFDNVELNENLSSLF